MSLILIAALAENNTIGKDGKMPWNLKSDLRFFRKATEGFPVVMGRKTYQSLGKALPNRGNVVISKDTNFTCDDAIVVNSLEYAIDLVSDFKHAFIIGGAQIFKQAIHRAQFMYLSHIKASVEGDTFFPQFDEKEWNSVSRTKFDADERNDYPFEVVIYARTI